MDVNGFQTLSVCFWLRWLMHHLLSRCSLTKVSKSLCGRLRIVRSKSHQTSISIETLNFLSVQRMAWNQTQAACPKIWGSPCKLNLRKAAMRGTKARMTLPSSSVKLKDLHIPHGLKTNFAAMTWPGPTWKKTSNVHRNSQKTFKCSQIMLIRVKSFRQPGVNEHQCSFEFRWDTNTKA